MYKSNKTKKNKFSDTAASHCTHFWNINLSFCLLKQNFFKGSQLSVTC